MRIGVPKEIKTNENRVALVPAGAEALTAAERRVRVVPMGLERSGEQYEKRVDPRGRNYFWALSDPVAGTTGHETDVSALAVGGGGILNGLPIVWAVIVVLYRGRWLLASPAGPVVAPQTIAFNQRETIKAFIVTAAVVGALPASVFGPRDFAPLTRACWRWASERGALTSRFGFGFDFGFSAAMRERSRQVSRSSKPQRSRPSRR